MDGEHQRRIAVNEALFRKHNEAIRDAVVRFKPDDASEIAPEFMCECPITECGEMIAMTIAEYEHVRSTSTWFVVKPEHMLSGAEEPVEQNERYWIVRKLGEGARVAEASAPPRV